MYNEFEEIEAGEQDNVFCFDGDKILVSKSPDGTLIVQRQSILPDIRCSICFVSMRNDIF
ncbi:hypothetical protein RVY71_08620 [Emergencia timonensis]|uniref:hypothetical protein n=1 Tax=Emergencia timonensis TaxID=1776384 RepID=UPI00295AF152|nr:hypothetical protein [Emergencia timonensis]WNX90331.1 hypothetical protein RVY71_08620 [Emergencia timonensis]